EVARRLLARAYHLLRDVQAPHDRRGAMTAAEDNRHGRSQPPGELAFPHETAGWPSSMT
ncbi:hypothetical protein JL475_36055, partial [Streptomyces sp. M2CJ-2]|nr:hypothetical protein [Streptomyces sp. M2CJ-2]